MSQTVYNRYMGLAVPGLIADAQYTAKDGLQAAESIGLGLAVVQKIGFPNQGRLPKANKVKLVFSADLSAANVVDLKINGTAMASVTYNTSHAHTMALIIAALEGMVMVDSAILDASDTDNRTMIVYAVDGYDLIVTEAVVTGGSAVTITDTDYTTDVIYGISIMSQAIEQARYTGIITYASGAPVGCLIRGRIWVTAETVVTNGDPVYMRFLGNGTTKFAGSFRNDDDSGTAVLVDGAVWRTVTSATGSLAIIETNQPQ
jgi:hypothetical protein